MRLAEALFLLNIKLYVTFFLFVGLNGALLYFGLQFVEATIEIQASAKVLCLICMLKLPSHMFILLSATSFPFSYFSLFFLSFFFFFVLRGW